MHLIAPCLALLALCSAPLQRSADLRHRGGDERDAITLKNGKVLRGRVVLELADRVILRVGSKERSVPRDKVEAIRSLRSAMATVLEEYRSESSPSATWLQGLAERCDDAGLEHEAKLFHWRAILTAPDHAPSHEALGHRQKKGTWQLRVGRSWKSLEDAGRAHAKWSKAWELRSEHFAIRCDSGIERSVNTLLELEFCYRGFLDLFQRSLELREITEPMQVYVFRDREQFPSISDNVSAFYSGAENILYTYVAGRGRPTALFHEATHAILANSTVLAARGRGELPAWLNEGWADYMEGVVVPQGSGRCRIDIGRRLSDRVLALQGSEKPYGLQRLLNFKTADYMASTRQSMKYAQGYALFVTMLESEAQLEDFVRYLREAIDGKGQASTFRKIFRRDLESIEEAHLQLR